MVEKIIVSPESIRGLGNVVMPKTGADFEEYNCTMEVEEDTVNGEDVTVYVLTPETTSISLVLSSSVDSCGIGDSVVLSVTVTEDSVPVTGQSVSFRLGGTEIGTGTTNSSGVATYTYTTADVGSLNFTSVYAGHSSNSVSVVVSHDYSIAFDSSSYSTSDGSVTCYVTLLDNSVAVSGASISLTGTGSTLSATTNSSGVATFNLTGISADCTITATYSNVSDTATVTVQTGPLFYDDCSTDKTSQYGSSVSVDGKSTTESLSFSTDHYVMSGSGSGFAGFVIPNVNQDNVKARIKFKLTQTSSAAYNQFGFGVGNVGAVTTSNGLRVRNDKKFQQFNFTNGAESEGDVYTHGTVYSSNYFYVELIKQGTSLTIKLYDKDLNQLATNTRTITNYTTPQYMFYNLSVRGTSYATHIQEILVEAL